MNPIRDDQVRQQTKKTRRENFPRWRLLDPMLLLASLALSIFGICAVYVAGTDAREAYAMNQGFGFAVGLKGAIPLALIDYRIWQRFLRPIYGIVLALLLAVNLMGEDAGGARVGSL